MTDVTGTGTLRASTVFRLLGDIKDLLADFHPELYRVAIHGKRLTAELEFTVEISRSVLDRAGSAITLEIPEQYEFEYLRRDDRLVHPKPSPVDPPTTSTYQWKIPAPDPGEYTLAITGPISAEFYETLVETDDRERKTIRTEYTNEVRLKYTPLADTETLIEWCTGTTEFDNRYLLREVRERLDEVDLDEASLSDDWTHPGSGQSYSANTTTSDDDAVVELVDQLRNRVEEGYIEAHIQVPGDYFEYDDTTFERNELGLPKSFTVTVVTDLGDESVVTREKVTFDKSEFWDHLDTTLDAVR
ncbi:hypothetical protein [Haloarcula halophila]|uniref:hypothetical protein n=1 Tax=Haloarcula TaxID=2237 RepID=UPI0023E37A80|nr:hypothetical protein [Halomicroarcula sp. DFY41]